MVPPVYAELLRTEGADVLLLFHGTADHCGTAYSLTSTYFVYCLN